MHKYIQDIQYIYKIPAAARRRRTGTMQCLVMPCDVLWCRVVPSDALQWLGYLYCLCVAHFVSLRFDLHCFARPGSHWFAMFSLHSFLCIIDIVCITSLCFNLPALFGSWLLGSMMLCWAIRCSVMFCSAVPRFALIRCAYTPPSLFKKVRVRPHSGNFLMCKIVLRHGHPNQSFIFLLVCLNSVWILWRNCFILFKSDSCFFIISWAIASPVLPFSSSVLLSAVIFLAYFSTGERQSNNSAGRQGARTGESLRLRRTSDEIGWDWVYSTGYN